MSAAFIERHDGWAELVLNRPERKNAIEGTLAEDFRSTLAEINGDESIRAIVLRGAGGAFCSGLDVKAFNTDPPPAWAALSASSLLASAASWLLLRVPRPRRSSAAR